MQDGKKLGTVLIAGGRGNLGRKLTSHLLGAELCERVLCLDHPGAKRGPANPAVVEVDIDLAAAGNPVLAEAMDGVDAVVHFAASNPAPDAPWDQSRESFEMTLRIASQAAASGVRRLVFASSNHSMGRYKDPPLSHSIRAGELGAQSFPSPGTVWHENGQLVDGVAYGSTKLLGESVCSIAAENSGGRMTSVSIRIGWCQRGANRPETITASGIPKGDPAETNTVEGRRSLRWFRNMWLSDRDFAQVMEKALLADPSGWPAPGIIVNGMSGNRGMAWDVETARRLIGYVPQDDIWTALGLEPPPFE